MLNYIEMIAATTATCAQLREERESKKKSQFVCNKKK